jgi:16S rRNA (guanine527-N7)-methyltransferase
MKQFDRTQLAQILKDGVRQLSLQLNEAQCDKLLDYVSLLQKWNGVYNLTAVRDPMQMMTQHLLDSLAALPAFVGRHNILDVGAGGGLPGIVLAIARPDMQVSLIDTVQKKTAFLTQVKSELGLSNVTVHSGRVEQLKDVEKFDAITSRAFSDLNDFISLSEHLMKDGGIYIAMKGVIPQDEITALPADWKVKEIVPLKVPGMQAERHLILMNRSSE